jgi:hypothetical protein
MTEPVDEPDAGFVRELLVAIGRGSPGLAT